MELEDKLDLIRTQYDYEDTTPHTCPIINDIQNSLEALKEEISEDHYEMLEEIDLQLEVLRDHNSSLRDLAYEHHEVNNKLIEINESLVSQLNDVLFPPNQLYLFESSPKKFKPITHQC